MEEMLKAIKNAELVLIGFGEECVEDKKESKKLYESLYQLLNNKNYFLITINVDSEIHNYGFKEERIVEPCGSNLKLQCKNACEKKVYNIIKNQVENMCPICKEELVYNICTQENYLEEGYLEQWDIYMKWLQGTLNKKLCVIELGVGMDYPTVIRWPFEKISFLNQKAVFFRIHSRLAQVTREIEGRATSILQSPSEFFAQI